MNTLNSLFLFLLFFYTSYINRSCLCYIYRITRIFRSNVLMLLYFNFHSISFAKVRESSLVKCDPSTQTSVFAVKPKNYAVHLILVKCWYPQFKRFQGLCRVNYNSIEFLLCFVLPTSNYYSFVLYILEKILFSKALTGCGIHQFLYSFSFIYLLPQYFFLLIGL